MLKAQRRESISTCLRTAPLADKAIEPVFEVNKAGVVTEWNRALSEVYSMAGTKSYFDRSFMSSDLPTATH